MIDQWWCPQHNGPPMVTLDMFPPLCGTCRVKCQPFDLRGVRGGLLDRFTIDNFIGVIFAEGEPFAQWLNGYLSLPKGHLWYGMACNAIKCNAPGGIIYVRYALPTADLGMGERWIIGFDGGRRMFNEHEVRHAIEDLAREASEV